MTQKNNKSNTMMKPPIPVQNRSQMLTAPSPACSQMNKTSVGYVDATTTSSVSSAKSGKVPNGMMMSKRSLMRSGQK